MSEILSLVIAGVVIVIIVAFIVFIIGLREIPMGERPKTPTYNRLGQVIGETENPDFHVNPGEAPNVQLEAEMAKIERDGSA